jgi:uncharacterized protein (DUF885 family)
MRATTSQLEENLCRAETLIDKIWRRRSDAFLLRVIEGRPIERFPDLSEAAAERTATQARAELARLQRIDCDRLPHQLALTSKIARFVLSVEAQAADRYWLAHDCGMYFPAMFPIGSFGSGLLFTYAAKIFTSFSFSSPGDGDRYLALLEDYATLIDQMREKLLGQQARGIRIPQASLPGMRALVTSQAEAARKELKVHPMRLRAAALPADFSETVAHRLERRLALAFALLLETIGPDYAAHAPETVGMAQFKDGLGIYETLVSEHLSLPMTIDAVHKAGHDRMARLEDEMTEIRNRLGKSDRKRFHLSLLTDPAWCAHSPADVQARFESAVRRIEPHIDSLFRFKPAARYRVARLDPKLETTMTYGYFQDPIAGHPDGVYYFNGSNVSERSLVTAPALIYHELVPGHHFHWATQTENELLHPLRKYLMFGAFNEGWAEYAATLAGEVGMYGDPRERYGRLLNDAFLTSRLVVDTGMNALGWSLDKARLYMRDHSIMSEAEIASESLRYSTDIPAQSLTYKIGEIKMHELRKRTRSALGERFDIRDFHDAVLRSGAMPLDILEWHVDHWLESQAEDHGPQHPHEAGVIPSRTK